MSREILEFLVTSSQRHPPDGRYMIDLAKLLETMDGQDITDSIVLLEKLIEQKVSRPSEIDHLEKEAIDLLRAICTCWKCKQLIDLEENEAH